jgi:hypothetical protein
VRAQHREALARQDRARRAVLHPREHERELVLQRRVAVDDVFPRGRDLRRREQRARHGWGGADQAALKQRGGIEHSKHGDQELVGQAHRGRRHLESAKGEGAKGSHTRSGDRRLKPQSNRALHPL